jgi:hypothetical protein
MEAREGLSALVCNPGVSVVVRRSRLEKRHRLRKAGIAPLLLKEGLLMNGQTTMEVKLEG